MPAALVDGAALAKSIREELAKEISEKKEVFGRSPGLATIIVGERKDSQTYVRLKCKAAVEIGMNDMSLTFPDTLTEDELLAEIGKLAANPLCDGILVQLPLPPHIRQDCIIGSLPPDKDVDGLHSFNFSRLADKGAPGHAPCTPAGVLKLIKAAGCPSVKGKHVVVIGRSHIVGLPLTLLLLRHDATVTVVHSATPDPKSVTSKADIVVSATGRPGLVTAEWIKPGAIVIDVGTTPVPDASKKAGFRLAGDCDASVCDVAGFVTPVPGGCGPMTIAMLLSNTVNSWRDACQRLSPKADGAPGEAVAPA